MSTTKHSVRAINIEEVLSIINNANGIYESSLVNLLQCNRINLENRLKTLEQNKLITRKKTNKTFYLTKSYDPKNLIDLEMQSIISQQLYGIAIQASNIQLTTNPVTKNKEILIQAFIQCSKLINSQRKFAESLLAKDTLVYQKNDLARYLNSGHVSFPIRLANADELSIKDYYTTSLDYLDILAIPSSDLLETIKKRVTTMSNIRTNYEKSKPIRQDIILYVKNENRFLCFQKSALDYKPTVLNHPFVFLYLIATLSSSRELVYCSDDSIELENWLYLYEKRRMDKLKYGKRK